MIHTLPYRLLRTWQVLRSYRSNNSLARLPTIEAVMMIRNIGRIWWPVDGLHRWIARVELHRWIVPVELHRDGVMLWVRMVRWKLDNHHNSYLNQIIGNQNNHNSHRSLSLSRADGGVSKRKDWFPFSVWWSRHHFYRLIVSFIPCMYKYRIGSSSWWTDIKFLILSFVVWLIDWLNGIKPREKRKTSECHQSGGMIGGIGSASSITTLYRLYFCTPVDYALLGTPVNRNKLARCSRNSRAEQCKSGEVTAIRDSQFKLYRVLDVHFIPLILAFFF